MASAVKPRVFIGSSKEQLHLAKAVQQNLHHDFETTVWDQAVFKASAYPLESLAEHLDKCDFGIFVLAPDDVVTLRRRRLAVARDNVIFELGMFVGKLGRERSFMLVPQQAKALHLPTDLMGLTPVTYEAERRDKNFTAAVGAACSKLRDQILSLGGFAPRTVQGLIRAGLFTDFSPRFEQLLDVATTVTLCFIHSRRWRENHNDRIAAFLGKPRSRLHVFLPDLNQHDLMKSIEKHFDDGRHIRGFVQDAYRYFASLQATHRSQVTVRLYQLYPTYTFYLFDKLTAVLAMYPTTTLRKSVPAFEITMDGAYGQFLSSDLGRLAKESRKATRSELLRLASKPAGSSVRSRPRLNRASRA